MFPLKKKEMVRLTFALSSSGCWPYGTDEQAADEDHAAVDEGAPKAQAHLRPRRPAQAVPLHHLVHQPQERAAEAQGGAQGQTREAPPFPSQAAMIHDQVPVRNVLTLVSAVLA